MEVSSKYEHFLYLPSRPSAKIVSFIVGHPSGSLSQGGLTFVGRLGINNDRTTHRKKKLARLPARGIAKVVREHGLNLISDIALPTVQGVWRARGK